MNRPPLKIALMLDDGSEQEIKLSYGLFQDLQRLVPDPNSLVETMIGDPLTRDYIIRRCLTPLKKMVTKPEEELIAAEDVKLDDPDEIDKLLQWVAGHMLYFFATSAGGLKQLSTAFAAKLPTVEAPPVPSTTGSAN